MPYLAEQKQGRVRAVTIDVSYWGGSGVWGQQCRSPAMEMPPCISQAQVPSAAPHTLRCSPPWTPPLCPCARPTIPFPNPFIMSFLKSPHQVIQFKATLSVPESSINLCPDLNPSGQLGLVFGLPPVSWLPSRDHSWLSPEGHDHAPCSTEDFRHECGPQPPKINSWEGC